MLDLRPSKRTIPLGTDRETGEKLRLSLDWLTTHLHIIGPTGTGKSRLLFHLFQQLVRVPQATIILIDPKGSLYRMCRDWAILHGLTKRLVLFDPSDSERVIGYNPLKPNGLSWSTHAKAAREGIAASRGQHSFDETPQLARFLFLILAAARLLELTLIEAVGLLRSGSDVRKAVLPRLTDPFVRESLEYFDSLTPRRQEELTASTLARLEAFVYDPAIRMMLTQQTRSLDLAEVLTSHQILLLNLEQYRPLRPEDVKTLGRLCLNDILAHVFERPEGARSPVFLFIDEVQDFATRDLCVALDKGRGLFLHCLIAHQHCAQLMDEDTSGYLFKSVMNDARTKIVFGGSSVKDLEAFLVKEMLLDQYNPWTVKDELTSLELDPIETTRVSATTGYSYSKGKGIAFPVSKSETEGGTETEGESFGESQSTHASRGTFRSQGSAITQAEGRAHTTAEGFSHTTVDGSSSAAGRGNAHGSVDMSGAGVNTVDGSTMSRAYDTPLQVIPSHWVNSEQHVAGASDHASHAESASTNDFSLTGSSRTEADTESSIEADTRSSMNAQTSSESEGDMFGVGESQGHSHETSRSTSQSRSTTLSRGVTPSVNEQESWSESETIQPHYEYQKSRNVSSRTFLSEQEFLTLGIQKIKAQPTGHFLIKVPTKPAVFVRAPWVTPPRITRGILNRAHQRIYEDHPYYSKPEEIETEEHERTQRLLNPASTATQEEAVEPATFWHKKKSKSL